MMKRIIAGSIVIMLVALAVAGCGSSQDVRLSLTKDENINVHKGQVIIIELKANHTTGYEWQVLEETNKGILNPVGEGEYITNTADKRRMGSGGTEIYRFKAVAKGEAILIFEYKRPWEKKEPIKRYRVRIMVR
jgi:inhibitor of cysteine peptidase